MTGFADSPFARDLEQNAANHVPLSPISFLERSARVYPSRTAVIHGQRRHTYAEFRARVARFASALGVRGIGEGDTVAVMALNTPALLEAHYAVPAAGAVLNAINTRLDARTVRFILEHGEAKLFAVERALWPVAGEALEGMEAPPPVILVDEAEAGDPVPEGLEPFEAFLATGDAEAPLSLPPDEWRPIALNYTSGTTGNPKGVVYSHRGAHLNATGNAMTFGMYPECRYLWVLPMFHCNGWTHTWAVTLAGGTHVCLSRVEPARIFELVAEEGVTHFCAAPIVLTMLIDADPSLRRGFPHRVRVATGGAPPPSSTIARMEEMGFEVTHLYGLTETYGPAAVNELDAEDAAKPLTERARLMARQGVGHPLFADWSVADPGGTPVPADGATQGEILVRSNTVMMGYLKNRGATDGAFAGGWLHTGDLAVAHGAGVVEVRDRAKDIIISGGENISSVEVEEAVTQHPAVSAAAVVARPDPKWGESPCAFVELRPGATCTPEEIIESCRAHLAGFKVPRRVVFGPLPKTSTGKVQKFVLRDRAKALPEKE